MIDVISARAIAQGALDSVGSSRPLVILEEVDDFPSHWVFYYNDSRFLETGDSLLDVVDSGPIAVSKIDGGVSQLNGADPVDEQLDSGHP
jgi:Immunity protein 35